MVKRLFTHGAAIRSEMDLPVRPSGDALQTLQGSNDRFRQASVDALVVAGIPGTAASCLSG